MDMIETVQSVRSNIWKLYVIRALSGCLFSIPIIVLLFQTAGLTLQQIYLLQAGFGASILLLEIPSGYLSDRWGRKPTLIVGFMTGVAGYLLYTQAHDFTTFLLAELAVGVCSSFFSGTFESMTYDTLLELGEERENRRVAGNQFSFDLAAEACAALLGGLVALWSLTATLWLSAAAFLIGAAICFTLKEPSRHKPQVENHWKAVWEVCVHTLLTHRGLRSITLIGGLISAMSLALFWSTQPYQKLVGLPVYLWGAMHAITVLLGAAAARNAGWLERRADDRKILIGIAATIVGVYLILAVAPPHWAFLALFPASRIAWSLLHPLSTDMVNRMTTSDVRSTVLSVHSFGGRTIFIVASPLVAGLADDHGMPFAFSVAGIVGGVLLATMFIRLRTVWDKLPA